MSKKWRIFEHIIGDMSKKWRIFEHIIGDMSKKWRISKCVVGNYYGVLLLHFSNAVTTKEIAREFFYEQSCFLYSFVKDL